MKYEHIIGIYYNIMRGGFYAFIDILVCKSSSSPEPVTSPSYMYI